MAMKAISISRNYKKQQEITSKISDNLMEKVLKSMVYKTIMDSTSYNYAIERDSLKLCKKIIDQTIVKQVK